MWTCGVCYDDPQGQEKCEACGRVNRRALRRQIDGVICRHICSEEEGSRLLYGYRMAKNAGREVFFDLAPDPWGNPTEGKIGIWIALDEDLEQICDVVAGYL